MSLSYLFERNMFKNGDKTKESLRSAGIYSFGEPSQKRCNLFAIMMHEVGSIYKFVLKLLTQVFQRSLLNLHIVWFI